MNFLRTMNTTHFQQCTAKLNWRGIIQTIYTDVGSVSNQGGIPNANNSK